MIPTTENLFKILFSVLSKREQEVISRRFGLENKEKHTLETIGTDFNITRERVRQIENYALKKLTRVATKSNFDELKQLLETSVKQNGGIIRESELVNQILSQLSTDQNYTSASIQLALAISNNLKKFKRSKSNFQSWHHVDLDIRDIKAIRNSSIKILKDNKDTIDETVLLKTIANNSTINDLEVIKACLAIDTRIKLIEEGYGLTKWRHVQPKSIKDKALIILKRHGKPMHFVEIANAISNANFSHKQVTTQAVHNELIRYSEFVLVGRGLYALKEWGYTSGTVRDVITDILKNNRPMSKQEIVDNVLQRRHVKLGTISLNLQKYPEFERVERAVYRYNADLKRSS